MKEFTKGTARPDIGFDKTEYGNYTNTITTDKAQIATAIGLTIEQCEANAELIADAFNIAQRYGSLQELERQRDELYEALNGLIKVHAQLCFQHYCNPETTEVYRNALKLIEKATN